MRTNIFKKLLEETITKIENELKGTLTPDYREHLEDQLYDAKQELQELENYMELDELGIEY